MRQPSVGGSYELQGKPDMYEDIALEQLRYKRKKEDEKKAKEKELLDKYRGSLNVTGYDPIYNQRISSAAAGVVDELNKAQSGKYLNTIESNPEFRKKMAEFQLTAGNAKLRSQAIAQYEKEASDVANVGKITPNKELFDTLNASRVQGEVTPELQKFFGADGTGVDPNKFYSVVPATPADFSIEVPKVTNPITREYDIERDAGDVFKTKAGRVFEEESNRAQAKAIVNTKSSIAGQAALREAGGDPVKAEELVLENIRFRFDPKYAEKIREKSGAGLSEEQLLEIPKRKTIVNVGGESGSMFGQAKSEASFGLKKEIPITISLTTDATQASTNAPTTKVDARAAGSLAEPKVLPRAIKNSLKYGIVKGSIITEEKLNQLKNSDADLSEIISYQSLAPVSVTEQAPVYDDNGKVSYATEQILDDDGYPTGQVRQVPKTTKREETYYLPMGGTVGDTYKQQGYTKAVKKLEEEAKRANEGLVKKKSGDKKLSSSQEALVQKNMTANPDYTREEIIESLGY